MAYEVEIKAVLTLPGSQRGPWPMASVAGASQKQAFVWRLWRRWLRGYGGPFGSKVACVSAAGGGDTDFVVARASFQGRGALTRGEGTGYIQP